MMYTAIELNRKLGWDTDCDGMDEWIQDYLYDCFKDANHTTVYVHCSKWLKHRFIRSMKDRGFEVAIDPNSVDRYYITIPDIKKIEY